MKTETQIITVKQVYTENEFKIVSEDQKKFSVNLELINKLYNDNIIIYSKEPDLFGNIEFIATIIINKETI